MASTEIILASAAIGIAIVIALTHYIQLKKLEYIGNQTKETTEKLNTESVIRKIVNDVFVLKDEEKNKEKKYKCFFPVEYYKSSPLPSIRQGDFYAIHVLSTRLGEDNVDLIGIPKDEPIEERSLTGNVIFICSPSANSALKALFDIKKIENEDNREQMDEWLLKLDLPCWFVEYSQEKRAVRRIKVYNEYNNEIIDDLLTSPAEPCYIKAETLENGQKYEPDTNLQQDYGIFARINKNNSKYIIIAGIHQYGTWIVASLLSNLLGNVDVDYRLAFQESKDFICVISGEFDNKRLTINRKSIEVHKQYMWVKEDNKWIRKYRKDYEDKDYKKHSMQR